MLKIFLRLLLVALPSLATGQSNYNPAPIDVTHYSFSLLLSDHTDSIQGSAEITLRILKDADSLFLDLAGPGAGGRGMKVREVREDSRSLPFGQGADSLWILAPLQQGQTRTFTLLYSGIPADGLIIDKNKYGHRTFFSDNWPNRAHHWLPCADHPSDKAMVDFIITAPEHYQVVSNGVEVEQSNIGGGLRQSHWKETVELPTKVMVIGVADFAVSLAGNVECIPVSCWVYPENRENGFYDYALALEILPYFIREVGPYPYRKLANVQSKTIFGGMENASAIFYYENSVRGDRKEEPLLVHEIAHQWFGNSATEAGFSHLWLSEGFATYMTQLYMEHKYGSDTLKTLMDRDRQTVIAFSRQRLTPVVDSSVRGNFMDLLNANSYQKGGWVLHMLRLQLGDSLFWKGIRAYYRQYAGKNAATGDFQKIMETVSGRNLQEFFRQWLFRAGQPRLAVRWQYHPAAGEITGQIEQLQPGLFSLPLEMAFDGKILRVEFKGKITPFHLSIKQHPSTCILDPFVHLLFEGTAAEIK